MFVASKRFEASITACFVDNVLSTTSKLSCISWNVVTSPACNPVNVDILLLILVIWAANGAVISTYAKEDSLRLTFVIASLFEPSITSCLSLVKVVIEVSIAVNFVFNVSSVSVSITELNNLFPTLILFCLSFPKSVIVLSIVAICESCKTSAFVNTPKFVFIVLMEFVKVVSVLTKLIKSAWRLELISTWLNALVAKSTLEISNLLILVKLSCLEFCKLVMEVFIAVIFVELLIS